MLRNWLKIAFINYKKNWLSTFINLFGLTLGLTGFMLILMHWVDEESYESWNPLKEQIFYAQTKGKTDKEWGSTLSYPIAHYSKEKIKDIEDYVLFNGLGRSNKFTSAGKSIYVENGAATSEHFFNFFPFKLVAGTYKDALTDINSIAISSATSMKLFGITQSAGKSIHIDDRDFVVKAVYELPEANMIVKPDYVTLNRWMVENDRKNEQWGNFNYQTLFKLRPGVNPDEVAKEIRDKILFGMRAKLGAKEGNVTPEKFIELYGPYGIALTRIDKTKLHSKAPFFDNSDYKTILILFSLSVLIIILSAINFINLKTAQASQRAKEVGIRKAIGSNRMSLIKQFLMETLIICFAAYLLSLVLVELLLPQFNSFFNKNIKFNNLHVFGYSFFMVVATSILAGIIPAFYLSNFKAIETLKGNFARSKHGIWLRNSILALQLIISSFFIIGSIIVGQQVKYMMNKDLGFNGDQIIEIKFLQNDPKPWKKYERLKAELSKIKGVKEVSTGEASPNNGSWSSSNMDFRDKSIQVRHGAMDYNYLQMMGMKLKSGRWLNPKLSSDTINTMIVNEAFARKFGWKDEDSYAKEFSAGFDDKHKYRVVGVLKDVNLDGFQNEIQPVAFFHYLETEWKRTNIWAFQVKLDKENMPETVEKIKNYWSQNVEQGYPFTYEFINKQFARTYEKFQKQQVLFNILNGIVLLVALLGLFALSSLMIEQKLKEVAIRKTLGASDSSLVLGLTKKFLWITIIAVIISLPIAYYFMNEWLKDFAYRIDMPIWPYILSLFLLLILTFTVVSFKAFKATKISLSNYLKYE